MSNNSLSIFKVSSILLNNSCLLLLRFSFSFSSSIPSISALLNLNPWQKMGTLILLAVPPLKIFSKLLIPNMKEFFRKRRFGSFSNVSNLLIGVEMKLKKFLRFIFAHRITSNLFSSEAIKETFAIF